MKTTIRFHQVERSEACERYILSQLHAALDRIALRLGPIHVTIDREGPAAVSCHVALQVFPDRHLEVDARGPTVFIAADRAIAKIATSTTRALARLQRHARAV